MSVEFGFNINLHSLNDRKQSWRRDIKCFGRVSFSDKFVTGSMHVMKKRLEINHIPTQTAMVATAVPWHCMHVQGLPGSCAHSRLHPRRGNLVVLFCHLRGRLGILSRLAWFHICYLCLCLWYSCIILHVDLLFWGVDCAVGIAACFGHVIELYWFISVPMCL